MLRFTETDKLFDGLCRLGFDLRFCLLSVLKSLGCKPINAII
jgi:hypothetical protein